MRGKVYITFSRKKITVHHPLKISAQRYPVWRNTKLEGKKQEETHIKGLPNKNSITNEKPGNTAVFNTEGGNCCLHINNKSSRSGNQHVCNERPHKKGPEPSGF